MSESGDFDLQAAWLRRFHADAEGNMNAFALRLKEALPNFVTVHETKGFLSRSRRVTGISIDLGNQQFTLDSTGGRLRATIKMIVRGITLNTKEMDPAEWFARLAQETKATTAQARALSLSLQSFMAS
ncbi:MAG: hypothetical protein ACRYF2_26890 [Janthinobacterium lividum]